MTIISYGRNKANVCITSPYCRSTCDAPVRVIVRPVVHSSALADLPVVSMLVSDIGNNEESSFKLVVDISFVASSILRNEVPFFISN